MFAAGDVAGGAPQKYVTGALAEGEIAGDEIVRRYQDQGEVPSVGNEPWYKEAIDAILKRYVTQQGANDDSALAHIEAQEQRLQDIMDVYAGGISQAYKYTEESLGIAKSKLQALAKDVEQLQANTLHELSYLYELRDRIVVAQALVAHLGGRKETRWHSFGEHGDYPNCNDEGLVYVNSVYQDGEFQVFQRPLVEKGDTYEHTN